MLEMRRSLAVVLLVMGILSWTGAATWEVLDGDPALKVGDAAPKLVSGRWLKGDPVRSLEKGKVYVVEFWGSRCGPCLANIPHLSSLQEQYKDIVVIGQNWREDEPEDAVKLVDQMGGQMNYRVAMDDLGDDAKGAMDKAWMIPAGRDTIPTAFVVGKDGRIAWIGHPAAMDMALKQVVDGTYNVDAQAVQYLMHNRQERQLQASLKVGKWDDALGVLQAMMMGDPEAESEYGPMKMAVLRQKGDLAGSRAWATSLAERRADDPELLASLAEVIISSGGPKPSPEDWTLAQKLASQANDLTKGQDSQMLSLLGWIHFQRGDVQKAIIVQTKALELAQTPRAKTIQQRLLNLYQSKVAR